MGSDSKGQGGGSKSYDYYATFAAVFRAGLVDTAHALLVDGKAIWEGPINRTDGGVGNPYTITPADSKWLLEGGYIKLYWGTDSQTADAALELHGHPPYRGFCYIVFCRFLCGRERTNLPNIEFIATAAPTPPSGIITSTSVSDDRANPWAIVADLLTSRHGLGLEDARLDAASFQSAHDYLEDDAELKLLSYAAPLLTSQQEARTFCDGLLGSFGGLLRVTGSGEVEAVQPTLDPGSLSLYLQLTENDYSKPPEVDAQTWDDVPTGIALRFANKDRQFKEDVMIHDDPLALQLVGENRRTSIDRKWITSSEQARRVCAEWAKRFCRPVLSGTAYIRSATILRHPTGSPIAGEPIQPGDRIRLDVDSTPGGSGSSQLVRVLDMRRGQKGGVSIRWQAESISPQVPFSPAYTVPENATPEPSNITDAILIPLPLALSAGREPRIAVLATRPDEMVTGCDVEFDVEDGAGTFVAIGTQIRFAVKCRVDADYSATASGDIRLEIMETLDQRLALAQPGPSGAQDDTLLVICYRSTDGLVDLVGDVPDIEIMSIQESAAVSTDTYDFTVLRSRFATPRAEWLEDSTAWIVPRSSLVGHFHTTFRDRLNDGTEMTFHLRSFNAFSTYDSTLTDFPAQFSAWSSRKPRVVGSRWGLIRNAFPRELASEGVWDIVESTTDRVQDADGNATRLRIEYRQVGYESWTEIIDQSFRPTREMTFADIFALGSYPDPVFTFPLEDAASFWVHATVYDSSGLLSLHKALIFSPYASQSPTPLGPPEEVSRDASGNVTVTGASGTTSIEYAIVDAGEDFTGSSPYSAPVVTISAASGTFAAPGNVRVWIRVVKSGTPDEYGPWVDYDFEDPTFPSQP